MAVYCPSYRLLFIGNKRTASTALGRTLVAECGGIYLPPKRTTIDGEVVSKCHSTLAQLMRFGLLTTDPGALLKFTAVRNPFDSLATKWLKRLSRPRFAKSRAARGQFDLETYLFSRYGDIEPYSMHARYVQGMDVVIRYESLLTDLATVLDRAGAPRFELPIVNPTTNKTQDYRAYYTDRARELVTRIFAEDLERYGYAF